MITAGTVFHIGDSYCIRMHLLRIQAPIRREPAKKLMRNLSGLGGVSDRTLAKQLAWIRQHPEVLCASCIYGLAV